jgi:hypothetical protein
MRPWIRKLLPLSAGALVTAVLASAWRRSSRDLEPNQEDSVPRESPNSGPLERDQGQSRNYRRALGPFLRILLIIILGIGCSVALRWKYNHEYYHNSDGKTIDVGIGVAVVLMLPVALWFGGVNRSLGRLGMNFISGRFPRWPSRIVQGLVAVSFLVVMFSGTVLVLYGRFADVPQDDRSFWSSAIPVATFYALVSAGISFAKSWRHYVAFGLIVSAVAILYLDNVALVSSSNELDDFEGLQPTWRLTPIGRTSLKVAQMQVSILDEHHIQGKIIVEGNSTLSATATVSFPPQTEVLSVATGYERLRISSVKEPIRPGYFSSEVLFWWTGDVSKTMGIGRSLYKLGFFLDPPLDDGELPGNLVVELPNGPFHFGDLFPVPTSAPEYQTAAWEFSRGGEVTVQLETISITRTLAEQSTSILLVGFGFFLGSLNVPKLRSYGSPSA